MCHSELSDNGDEVLPVVDVQGRVVGSATRRECHSRSNILHPVVHLHLIRSDGALFLQLRPMSKFVQPGKWDTAVGGHVDFGESIDSALLRETQEELGLTDLEVKFIDSYIFESEIERELVYVYFSRFDDEISHFSAEVSAGRYWTVDEINLAIGTGVLTPNFEKEYLNIVRAALSTIV